MSKRNVDLNGSFDRVEIKHVSVEYIAKQKWNCVYDAQTALKVGTIFPELLKPFQTGDFEEGGSV